MIANVLVGLCLFIAGIAFYKHRKFVKFEAAAKSAGVLAAVKARL